MGAPAGNVTYANQGSWTTSASRSTTSLASDGSTLSIPMTAIVFSTWTHSVATGDDYDIEARMIRARDGRCPLVVDSCPARSRRLRQNPRLARRRHRHRRPQDLRRNPPAPPGGTERQRAELETIYQTAPIGLALFDPVEFRYLRINDRQCETLGLPREKILGHPITELAPLKGLREIFEQVAKGHPVRNLLLEGELPTRPGEHRYWNVSYSPVYNANGSVEAIAAVILEITTQKKAEAALIQSEKLAAVGRLASSISHEINNPLEAITNLLYLVALSDELPEGVRNYVQIAQSELSRVCQIATQTLRFHRQAVRATQVTAADLVGAVLNLYHGRLANSSIRVEASYDPTLPSSVLKTTSGRSSTTSSPTPSTRCVRAAASVVRAHDATGSPTTPRQPPGHPHHHRRYRPRHVPAVRARLFEPFYTTKDLNGTGLGLWISSGIVGRHHGRLTFRTSQHPIHHGTVFSLFIPRAETGAPIIEAR